MKTANTRADHGRSHLFLLNGAMVLLTHNGTRNVLVTMFENIVVVTVTLIGTSSARGLNTVMCTPKNPEEPHACSLQEVS